MPRLDFEKQFARQLKDRELKPSSGSWEKLQGRLEQEEKKSSSRFWWIGIAATLVGAFILFNFIGNSPSIEEVPSVVESSEHQNDYSEQEVSLEQVAAEEQEANEETVPLRRDEALPKVTRETKPSGNNTEIASTEGPGPLEDAKENANSEVEEKVAVVVPEVAGGTEISDAEINALLEKAMAEVSREMGGEAKVTNAEIDALLANARATVRQEQALNSATVSADQLLTEVETELEHSFRAQVFEIIKDGLRKTRNAVANINE